MDRLVQKFGGSSLATPARIRMAAEVVRGTYERGFQVAVVVSAMGDTTDRLLGFLGAVSRSPRRAVRDQLLATGEMAAVALLAASLEDLGLSATPVIGAGIGIETDPDREDGVILSVNPLAVYQAWQNRSIPVVAGFQGVSRQGQLTTLGRGGSDLSAVALAAALGAECQICSDVDGVYTADPRLIGEARRISQVPFRLMKILARRGARVLQGRAVEWAERYHVPLNLYRTEDLVRGQRDPGTVVNGETAQAGVTLLAIEPEVFRVPAPALIPSWDLAERNGVDIRVNQQGPPELVGSLDAVAELCPGGDFLRQDLALSARLTVVGGHCREAGQEALTRIGVEWKDVILKTDATAFLVSRHDWRPAADALHRHVVLPRIASI